MKSVAGPIRKSISSGKEQMSVRMQNNQVYLRNNKAIAHMNAGMYQGVPGGDFVNQGVHVRGSNSIHIGR